ncbi:MAG: hypothetical protein E7773_14745 [Sphingomonas sp.]|uniref:hypothetical protein n=1 Tax=Sphingomonas sp. TaxID=28214 RepID=UPI001202728E|nr:hypothetical protein [Sphingomonas sp.]THD34444.1 MAG: hypothetical protein E7773_14745 [Sphingomonas sp.]
MSVAVADPDPFMALTLDRTKGAALRAASSALRRCCAAFGLDRRRFLFDVSVDAGGDSIAVAVEYGSRPGQRGMAQRRDVGLFYDSNARMSFKVRKAVDEMVWNVALAFHSETPVPPTGWSVHPVVASLIAASGSALPNPADPLAWLRYSDRRLRLPDGGNVVDAFFRGREGVLTLESARIVDAGGRHVARLAMDGPRLNATFEGAFPATIAEALVGRRAGDLCSVFSADPRGRDAKIVFAVAVSRGDEALIVGLGNSLVPLLPTVAGGERWRPRRVSGDAEAAHTGWQTRHVNHRSIMRYYARARASLLTAVTRAAK